MRNFTIIFALMVIFVVAVTTGCVSKEAQEAKIAGDVGYSIGYIDENQTNIQKISWTASITNTGDRIAEDVKVDVILHPNITSRLNTIEESTVLLGDLKPDVWKGFKGNVTFITTGMSKQEIATWDTLVKIKVIWVEDGKVNEKILPVNKKIFQKRVNET